MARPTTNKNVSNITNATNTKVEEKKNDFNVELQNELKLEKEKNEKLENKLDSLMSMVEKLTEKQSEMETKVEENKNVSNIIETYKSIDPTRRVLLINMSTAAGTYTTHSGRVIRFERFRQILPSRFEDVESLRNKYRNTFEELEIMIAEDQEIIDALYLTQFYKKYNVKPDEIEDIITLDSQKMIERIKELPKALQESVLCVIIQGIADTNPKYLDRNKIEVINNAFNIKLEELAETYRIKN